MYHLAAEQPKAASLELSSLRNYKTDYLRNTFQIKDLHYANTWKGVLLQFDSSVLPDSCLEVLILTPCSNQGRVALSGKKNIINIYWITGIHLIQAVSSQHSLSALLWFKNSVTMHQVLTTAVLSLCKGTVLRKLENSTNQSLDCHQRRGPLTFKTELFEMQWKKVQIRFYPHLKAVLFGNLNENYMHAVWCTSSVLNQLLSVFV